MSTKMKQCKACGTEMYKGAKICPKCGKKQGGKGKFIVIAVVVIILIGLFAGGGSDDASTSQDSGADQSAQISYTQYDLSNMFDELESNAMVAEEKYTDAYVEVTGKISNIDSDGSYISIEPNNGEFYMIGMMCYFQDDEQKEIVKQKSVGDTVTIKGQIGSVGEVWGYDLDIDNIK